MRSTSDSVRDLNSTMSSTRLRNSGRKWRRSSARTRVPGVGLDLAGRRHALDKVIRADVGGHDDHWCCESRTVRPWASVRRPSSSTCSSVLNTSAWAFSTSSNSTHRVGLAPDRFRELAALLRSRRNRVALRRGGADRVALLVLAHVDPDHVVLGVERAAARVLASSVLPTPVGPRRDERADGTPRVLDAGAGPDDGVGDELHPPRPGRRRAGGGSRRGEGACRGSPSRSLVTPGCQSSATR